MIHKPYTPEEMAELERLERGVTGKLWEDIHPNVDDGDIRVQVYHVNKRNVVHDADAVAWKLKPQDAAFIAHARNEFPRLLALVKRYQEALENIQDWSEIEDAQQIAREALSGGEK